uniref:Uncharacterized protein n=1 Tax=Plectus sambesii TaxID=2011161 RepID=A0A914WBG8_9BILA
EGTVQSGLAVKLLNRLINEPDDDFIRTYGRSLTALSIEDFDDKNMLRDLRNLTQSALEHVDDKVTIDLLEQFGTAIERQMEIDETMPARPEVVITADDEGRLSDVEEAEDGDDNPSERSVLADLVADGLLITSAPRPLTAANRAPPATPATGRRGKLASEASVRMTRTATKARAAGMAEETPMRRKK